MLWLDRLKGALAVAARTGWAHPIEPSAETTRWIMLDVETSGLDLRRDRLLAIAAIVLQVDWPRGRIGVELGDSFEVVLKQDGVPDKENILLHGIGVQRQRDGLVPQEAMQAFADFVGASPLLAFHSHFDETMVNRYVRSHLGKSLPNPWVDIAQLCSVTHEHVSARALDDWLAHFGIQCAERHQAAADTLAECELLLRIWPKVAAQCHSWRDVQRLAAHSHWIGRAH